MPRLVCAAPVADRAWALPTWFACLAAQTRRPDLVLLLHSGSVQDDPTWETAHEQARAHRLPLIMLHDSRPPHDRHDNERFRTLADLRNRLLRVARDLRAERYLSLDTDVMLDDPQTLERLEGWIDDGADIASPATFLHPAASDPAVDEEIFWAYNAGWWAPHGTRHDPRRPWVRHECAAIDWGRAHRIDVPMAAWLGSGRAFDCCYEWHESGEDLGFAQDLDERALTCVWDAGLRAKHIWCREHLQAAEAVR